MEPHFQTCDICQEQIRSGHLARHKKRRHRAVALVSTPPPVPVEQSERVGDVLLACGLDTEMLGEWNIEELNKLPNIRRHRPIPHRRHTLWQVMAEEQLNVLPSLEELLVDIAYRARRNGSMTAGTEVWQDNDRVYFTPTNWVEWTKRLLEDEQLLIRVLNMPMVHIIGADRSQQYRRAAADVAARYIPARGAHRFLQNQPTANITPRGTRTEVHHDSEHHISTAFGLATRKSRPLKLWLLWPSTELRHLATCYSNTKEALARMDHGSFLVQMPGESVFVPPNSPHAVVALESCYLYGHTFSFDSWAHDPSTIVVEMRSGDMGDRACKERVNQLRLGLHSSDFRQVYIDQFIETWAMEAPVFRGQWSEFENLVALWANDTHDNGSCAWCVAAGRPEGYDVEMDSREHARAHLEGQMPPTGKDGAAEIRKP